MCPHWKEGGYIPQMLQPLSRPDYASLFLCLLPIPHTNTQEVKGQSRTYSKSQDVRQKDCLVQVLITDDEIVP